MTGLGRNILLPNVSYVTHQRASHTSPQGCQAAPTHNLEVHIQCQHSRGISSISAVPSGHQRSHVEPTPREECDLSPTAQGTVHTHTHPSLLTYLRTLTTTTTTTPATHRLSGHRALRRLRPRAHPQLFYTRLILRRRRFGRAAWHDQGPGLQVPRRFARRAR